MIKITKTVTVLHQIFNQFASIKPQKQIFYQIGVRRFCIETPKKMDEIHFGSLLERARKIVPDLNDPIKHKGQDGRIGVIGGSMEYTGAPYFSAIAALRTGADLAHVYTTPEAGKVIKTYSPDLIVHPHFNTIYTMERFEPSMEHLHALVIGPGLGRQADISNIREMIKKSSKLRIPLVFDADGLHLLLTEKKLLRGYSGRIILTPNQIEFSRLFGTDPQRFPEAFSRFGDDIHLTIIAKGANDRIYFDIDPYQYQEFVCPPGGSGRRCGGQGDLLSGSIATFLHWALLARDPQPELVSCFAASLLIKNANRLCFATKGRSMVCNDMIDYIQQSFGELFE